MTINSQSGFIRTEQDAQLEAEAVRLRSAGLTYRQIAERMGCDPSTAHRRCNRALAAQPAEAVSEYRALELERLDALQAALWPAAIGGDVRAVRGVLEVMTRRSKLLGLDKPVEVTLEHFSTADIDREVERLAQLLAESD